MWERFFKRLCKMASESRAFVLSAWGSWCQQKTEGRGTQLLFCSTRRIAFQLETVEKTDFSKREGRARTAELLKATSTRERQSALTLGFQIGESSKKVKSINCSRAKRDDDPAEHSAPASQIRCGLEGALAAQRTAHPLYEVLELRRQ